MYYYVTDSFVKQDKAALRILNKVNFKLTQLDMLGEVAEVTKYRPMKRVIEDGIAKGHTTIIIIGDNRSLNQAAMCVIGKPQIVLGLIPVGQQVSLGRALGLDRVDELADILAARKVEKLDVGVVNNRIFLGALEIGVTTDLQTGQAGGRAGAKAATGAPSVLRKFADASKLLFSGSKWTGITIACKVDGKYKLTAATQHCAIVNMRLRAGADVAEGARLLTKSNDAELDLVVLDDMPKGVLYKQFDSFRAARYEEIPHTSFVRGYKFQITSQPHLPIWADSSQVAETPAVVGVLPKELRMIVGKERMIV